MVGSFPKLILDSNQFIIRFAVLCHFLLFTSPVLSLYPRFGVRMSLDIEDGSKLQGKQEEAARLPSIDSSANVKSYIK
jgi:hypothetical protein